MIRAVPERTGAPDWIESSFRFVQGLDPIGLRALTAGRIIAPLVPGVLALSDRARYLSFYAWLLQRYADDRRTPTIAALSTWMLRREFEFGVAVRLCGRCDSRPTGMNVIGPAMNAQRGVYERTESVKTALGGYGLYYRTPMRAMDLVRLPGTAIGDEAIPVDVLNRSSERAVAVAEAFASAVAQTAYVRERWLDRDEPLPSEVLAEFGAAACLCRLDEHPAERDLLRQTILEPGPGQAADEVRNRREAFALVLDLAASGSLAGREDKHLRWAVWDAFEASPARSPAYGRVLTRWAALTAIAFVQDGINLLWTDGGRALGEGDRGEGLAWSDIERAVAARIDVGSMDVLGSPVTCTPGMAARVLRDSLVAATTGRSMQEVDLWAVGSKGLAAGLSLILITLARCPDLDGARPDWSGIAGVAGDWQPSLAAIGEHVRERLGADDTVGELALSLFDHLVLRAHESNAYSKLPDFTFRWRWEAGRLRLYPHPTAWDPLADMRAMSMTALLADLGYLATANGAPTTVTTPDGMALVTRVLG